MKRLVLIDGNALLHRAYHATPALTTSKGELVNAVYGFSSMLLKALDELTPDYLVVTWDMKAPTFRHSQYEAYKANRGPADESLSLQYDRVHQVIAAFNIPEFRLPGFEADDLVGALANQATQLQKALQVIIMTGDRDIMQLINSRIKVLMPRKTINDVRLYGVEEFVARYGFPPKQLTDYKGLAGDPSDNIPGVKGIGDVTATKLIQEYETVEKLYKNLKHLPQKIQTLLQAGKEDALLSKRLATIETDIPIKLDLKKCIVAEFDPDEVKELFEELEFKSLIQRIPGLHDRHPELVSGSYDEMPKQVRHDSGVTTNLDHAVEPVLEKMSKTGVLVDLRFLKKLGKDLKAKLADLEKSIYSKMGHEFNLNSPKQLQVVLFDELNLPVFKKTKTGRSTDEETLHELSSAHPIIPKLLEYRQLFKLISTYIDALPKYVGSDGRVHSTFNVEGAATGRLSSQNPNLQNIPIRGQVGGELRRAFIAPLKKVLLAADYSQIELRIMAHLSKDPGLIKAFNSGLDIHLATAARIFGKPVDLISKEERAVGKTMSFATLYGQGPHALSRQLRVDYNSAKDLISDYFEQFPRVKDWMQAILEAGYKSGYVETIWGRKRYIPELQASNRMLKAAGERAAINHPIQGTSADMIKKAMVEIDKQLSVLNSQLSNDSQLVVSKSDKHRTGKPSSENREPITDNRSCSMILQIHDELLFECHPKSVKEIAKMVKDKMENALILDVPVIVDLKVGPNWGEMEKLDL